MRVHSLSLGLARAYLLEYPAGLALVDAGSAGMHGRILRVMRSLNRDDLRVIFITHAHLDHYGSAAAIRQLTGAPIAIHRADAQAMADGKTYLGTARGRGRVVAWLFPLLERLFRPEATPPDRLLEDGQTLESFGLEARVVHTPGHTPGSCCLYVEGRYAFAGDLVSTTNGPHVQRYFADDWSLIPGSLARLQALRPEVVYPGHGRYAFDGRSLEELNRTIGP